MNPKMKLKNFRDYDQNCKEVEKDFQIFTRLWLAMMAGLIILIYVIAHFSEEIDKFINP
jgi:hypothetical protein